MRIKVTRPAYLSCLLAFGTVLALPAFAQASPAAPAASGETGSPPPDGMGRTAYSFAASGAARIRVFDREGERVCDRLPGDGGDRVDLSGFPEGNYLVWITDRHGRSVFARVGIK